MTAQDKVPVWETTEPLDHLKDKCVPQPPSWARTQPRQCHHVFRSNTVDYCSLCTFFVATPLRHQQLKHFRIFLVSEALSRCCVVLKLKNGLVPSSGIYILFSNIIYLWLKVWWYIYSLYTTVQYIYPVEWSEITFFVKLRVLTGRDC